MEEYSGGQVTNDSKKLNSQIGFTLLETLIASVVSFTIIATTLMIFMNINTSADHVYNRQELTDNMLVLQQIKPHIRQCRYVAQKEGKFVITKKDNKEIKLYVNQEKLFMEEWENNNLLYQKIMLTDVSLFNVFYNSPVSVKVTVQSQGKEYVITEHCR
jgi:type II secretory pathway component PulJ